MGKNAQLKYFIFNKDTDYKRGFYSNIKIVSGGITIENSELYKGIFFSRLLDSREKNTVWHRMCMEFHNISEAAIHITIYASESGWLEWKQTEYQIEEFLADKKIGIEDKKEAIKSFKAKESYDPHDLLLHEVKGRYLWIQIDLSAQSDDVPIIYEIKLMFPKQTWMEYLPEVYQSDQTSLSFLERFLGIYQSLYQDMTQKIKTSVAYFDPDVVEGEFLKWLGSWLSIDDMYIWTDEQLRFLIKNALYFYKIRGTNAYLVKMIQLYTGKKPYIVEYHQTEKYRTNRQTSELISKLYGDSPHIFTVIIDMDYIATNAQYKTILRIVNHAKPVHIESCIVILQPYIFLNQYSYLGINSVLGQYRTLQLDGFSSMPFSTIDAK